MPRVLLINQGHTSNLGDVAINTVITTFLKNHDIDVICRPFEDRVEYFSHLPLPIRSFVGKCVLHIEAILDLLNTLRIRRYLKTDAVTAAVIGGGELLIGQHPGLNSAFFCWTRELHKRGIPIVVVGVSRDSTRHPRFDSRYIQALENALIYLYETTQHRIFYRTLFISVMFSMRPTLFSLTARLPLKIPLSSTSGT
jgi:polysaccharide pyruvyl transferase WcaK-like protein